MSESKYGWVVTVECIIKKVLVCENCTEQQAREHPFTHATSETEMGMQDWSVEKVEPNE